MRLIDADALRKEIHLWYSDDLGILEHIDKQPTIESQPEIIRCKDCKHHNYWGVCVKIIEFTDAHKTFCTSDTFHCGYAERREERSEQ